MTIQLPAIYRVFIDTNGLFEGFAVLSDEEHYVILWGEDEVATANSEMDVDVYAPGFVAFAGNGGGEIYAFDTVGAVFMLPMIGMGPEAAIKVADDFLELARVFKRAVTSGKYP
ncbi:SMI1/KNR4 family protein [Variovorax sp. VRV01]|uniref:SMI1/KNR4 family protein n=1 Tax=Variovorax sp. VRV01 TaxID=2769259 RepID=UPI00177B260D|nr:SMI1/KNR4 family protein [Variovorax sp. VRV01]MBD9668011.1 SMI1/KNR4 family protein [Variovorax sp. VRV01]